MSRYSPVDVYVSEDEEHRLKTALSNGSKSFSLRIILQEGKKRPVLFTKTQMGRIERARLLGRNCISIKLTPPQMKANTEHTGGFLWTLAKAIGPAILGGIASAAANRLTHKAVKVQGSGLFVQKNGHCAKVHCVSGGGLYLSPHPKFHNGNGLFEVNAGNVVGQGLLLGDNSPFKDVPILNLLL